MMHYNKQWMNQPHLKKAILPVQRADFIVGD
jgi:hypothetical protein